MIYFRSRTYTYPRARVRRVISASMIIAHCHEVNGLGGLKMKYSWRLRKSRVLNSASGCQSPQFWHLNSQYISQPSSAVALVDRRWWDATYGGRTGAR